MNFFRKWFARKGKSPESNAAPEPEVELAAVVSEAKAADSEPIKVFDKYGRELRVPRDQWLKDCVLPAMQRVWNDPDALAGILISGFQDGFFNELEPAAKHLQEIDPNAARGSSLLGVLYLQCERPALAQQVLETHVKRHGDDGVVLTNLAKAQDALGQHERALKTLWHALEIDPNQDNGLAWYEGIHREKSGLQGSIDALRRVAALPHSWRALLWLARQALEDRNLDGALEYYRRSLDIAGDPAPADMLMSISGDLGNQAHLLELIELVAPLFRPELHGLAVGNNLIKAYLDTGHHAEAREVLRSLQVLQAPGMREHLDYWEGELAKANFELQDPIEPEQLKVGFLNVVGPLWLKQDHPIGGCFPAKAQDEPHIALVGSTFADESPPESVQMQPANGAGRASRSLPLLFGEWLHVRTNAQATTYVPWMLNHGGGFVVSPVPMDAEILCHQVRQAPENHAGTTVPDYLVLSHLIICGEVWTLQLRAFRTIDASELGQVEFAFRENGFSKISEQVYAALKRLLAEEFTWVDHADAAAHCLEGPELDHYLYRLEQVLAVRCSMLDEASSSLIVNPAEILDGLVHLCLQSPQHAPSRILLWRALDGLKDREPDLVQSMKDKVLSLEAESPLAGEAGIILGKELRALLEA